MKPDAGLLPQPAPADKVPVKPKLAYGAGAFTAAWSEQSLGALANPIFVVMFGLSPSVLSIAGVVYRIWDGFTDLLIGWLSDNARTRWGRRRPFIFIGAILTGLWLPMMWMFDPAWSKTALALWMLGCFFGLYLFHAIWNIPWQSLLLEMTPDSTERTNVAAIRGYIGKTAAILPGWIWFFTQLPIFHHTGKIPDVLLGARWVTFAIGLLVIATGVLPALFVKERFYDEASRQAKVSMRDNLKFTLSNRPFVMLAIFTLLFMLGTNCKNSLAFFTTLYFVCGGDSQFAAKLTGLATTLTLVTGLAGIPLFQWLAHRFGKREALAAAMWITLTASISTLFFYTPRHPYLSILSAVLLSPAANGMWILIPSMNGDAADYDELHTGERREGAYSAVYSWVLKLAVSAATGLAGPLVELAGYKSELAVQPERVLLAMRLMLAVLPAVFILGAIFVLRYYTLDQARVLEVRAALEARRGKV